VVFENKLLSRTDGSKRQETTEGLRTLRIKGLHNLNPSHNIIMMIISSSNEIGTTCTYLLTYLLHGAGYYLKSLLYSACQKISCFLMQPEDSSPCSHKPETGP
jgi:hypothetical protein